ncbi:MAG: tetratricopeptide repeat protein [Phycisphaeraceae bacterium]|nr:tetratricopeptide repeat protein [Phycisphaerales bacterium]MCB9843468.1 tetratricopeptide repeat protein [Phycisphaeraceae bacterium]
MEPIDLAHEDWQLATHHYQQGDIPGAEKLCREILSELPAHVGAMHLLGVICGQTGRLAEAVQTLQRAAQLEPSSSDILTHMSFALAQSGAHARALTGFIKVREINPASVDAIAMIGSLSLQLGRYGEAAEALSEAADLRPRTAEMQMLKGHAMLRIGRLQDAETSLRRALELKPGLVEASALLSECLVSARKYDEAERLCREHLAEDPRFCAQLIRLYQATGRHENAMKAAQESVESASPAGVAIRLVARGEAQTGDLIGAIQLIQTSLPRLAHDTIDMAGAMFDLAHLQFRAGNHAAALTTATQARSALAPQGKPKFARSKHYLRMLERLAPWPAQSDMPQWCARASNDAESCSAIVGVMGARSEILVNALGRSTSLLLTNGRSTLIGLGGEIPGHRLGSDAYPAMIAALDDHTAAEVRRSYLTQLRDVSGSKCIDTHEHNIEHLPALARVIPGFRAVVVVRDPFDALAEAMLEATVPDESALVLTSVADMAAGILGQFRILENTMRIPGLSLLIVDADRLAASPESELSRTIEFLTGAPPDSAAVKDAAILVRESQQSRLPAGAAAHFTSEFAPIRALLESIDIDRIGTR